MQSEEYEDLELIALYKKNGSQATLLKLYRRYEAQIFRLFMKYLKSAKDAEDASVDIYLELTRKLRTSNIQNFKSWLYVVCKNHALKRLKQKSKVLLAEETFSNLEVKSNGSEDHMNKLLETLPAAIDQLSEDQRWCIVLFYLQKKSYKEIQEIRGYDFNKVKSSIIHGKKNLMKILEKTRHESI